MDLLEYFHETDAKSTYYYWYTWASIWAPLLLIPYDPVFFTWAGWDWYFFEGNELYAEWWANEWGTIKSYLGFK